MDSVDSVYDLSMGKRFLPDDVNQSLLIPPSLNDWLPEGHLARFVVDVASALHLSAIFASYEARDGRGQQSTNHEAEWCKHHRPGIGCGDAV
jgi:hypothetical protein